jgi:hypothetical protein
VIIGHRLIVLQALWRYDFTCYFPLCYPMPRQPSQARANESD